MDFKQKRKEFSRFLAWLGLYICSFIARRTPEKCIYKFAAGIASLAYVIAAKQRKIALESLKLAFGRDKSPQQLKQIVRDCFLYMGKSAVELISLLHKPSRLKQRVSIVNKDVLDSAIAQKRGVILVSAHFGNFPLMLARLSLEGYDVAGIMRPMRDKRVEKIFLEKRNSYNVRTIYSQPRAACVNDTIRVLRDNALVFIPVDQNFGTGGVFVDFFGQRAATATGPVIFAQRTGAVILPCFILRQKDDSHKIVFEPPLKLEPGNSAQEVIVNTIQKITNVIESYVRRYPAEWGWIHRRWKTKERR